MASPGDSKVSRSPWARARGMAKQTPPQRNRYVDFLRALSILAVATGAEAMQLRAERLSARRWPAAGRHRLPQAIRLTAAA